MMRYGNFHAVFFLLLLGTSSTALAQVVNPVLSSLSDPRSVALGGAGVALGGGILASDANPALLALAPAAQVQVLGPVAKGYHEDSRFWQVGVVWPTSPDRPYVPAVGVAYREYDLAAELLVRTAFEPEYERIVLTSRTKLTSLCLSLPVRDALAVGGALRYADARGVTGWYGDAGLVFGGELAGNARLRVDGTLAVAVRQLGEDVERVSELTSTGPDVFERVRVIAVPVRAHLAWGGTLRVAADVLAATLAFELIDPLEAGTGGSLFEHGGLELDYRNRIALRAGVANDDVFETEFTYGAGVRLPVASRLTARLDYAREPALPIETRSLIDDNAPDASHFFGLSVEYDLR